jgi:probable HAF family extracellular repeat protein
LPSTIIDLGTLSGAYSYAYGVNNRGQVVGISDGFSVTGYFPHAFLWDARHGLQDLGTFNGVGGSYAYGINDRGQVVGTSDIDVQGHSHAFLWDRAHGMQDLGSLRGANSTATAINERGQVAGTSSDAFLWAHRHGLQDLGNLGGLGGSSAAAINDRGQVVGGSNGDAFLWDSQHGLQDLGNLSGATAGTYAAGINDAGQVVGGSYMQLRYYRVFYHGFLWDAQNGFQDLGAFRAFGINDAGQVVGDSGQHAFLYQNGTLTDLNDLLPPDSGWTLEQARAINDAGQVVGYGDINGRTHAFLLTLDGGDQTGAAAPAISVGLIQIGGTLRERAGASVGWVDAAVAAAGSVRTARGGPGLATDGSSVHSAEPGQGPPVRVIGWEGETAASGSLDGFGDPVGNLAILAFVTFGST